MGAPTKKPKLPIAPIDVDDLFKREVDLRQGWYDDTIVKSRDGGKVFLERAEKLIALALSYQQSAIQCSAGRTQLTLIRLAGRYLEEAEFYAAAARRDSETLQSAKVS